MRASSFAKSFQNFICVYISILDLHIKLPNFGKRKWWWFTLCKKLLTETGISTSFDNRVLSDTEFYTYNWCKLKVSKQSKLWRNQRKDHKQVGFQQHKPPSFLDHVAWDFFEKQIYREILPQKIHCMVLLESPWWVGFLGDNLKLLKLRFSKFIKNYKIRFWKEILVA